MNARNYAARRSATSRTCPVCGRKGALYKRRWPSEPALCQWTVVGKCTYGEDSLWPNGRPGSVSAAPDGGLSRASYAQVAGDPHKIPIVRYGSAAPDEGDAG